MSKGPNVREPDGPDGRQEAGFGADAPILRMEEERRSQHKIPLVAAIQDRFDLKA